MHRFYLILKIIILLFLFRDCNSQGFRELDSAIFKENNIDVNIFRTLNNGRNNFSETIIPLTDKSLLPVSIILPTGLTGISRIYNNNYDENSGVLMILSEAVSAGISLGLKNIFKRERPFVTLNNVYYNKFNSPTDRYSFPSGHTATTFSIATSLTLRYPDKPALIVISYLYASVIGYGRIYLGVHYPSDVLGGMLIGAGSAVLVYSLRKDIIDTKNKILNENNKPDANSKNISGTAVLGFAISTDLLNIIVKNYLSDNISFNSNINTINAKFNF